MLIIGEYPSSFVMELRYRCKNCVYRENKKILVFIYFFTLPKGFPIPEPFFVESSFHPYKRYKYSNNEFRIIRGYFIYSILEERSVVTKKSEPNYDRRGTLVNFMLLRV